MKRPMERIPVELAGEGHADFPRWLRRVWNRLLLVARPAPPMLLLSCLAMICGLPFPVSSPLQAAGCPTDPGPGVAARPPVTGITYRVNPADPRASDDPARAPVAPFKTISAAARVVKPGDCVLIATGTYRESVVVEASGTAQRPIQFRAAPGARVVVTGADRLTGLKREPGPDNIYSVPWPHRFNTWTRSFAHPDDDYHLVIGRCEQVMVNGYELLHVLDRNTLARGTFAVDLDGKRLYLWPRNNADLDKTPLPVEASVRQLLWDLKGDYLQVDGILFRHAANHAQYGAVQIHGDNAVLSNCVIERMNALGADIRGANAVVRNCTMQDNGWDGFNTGAHHFLMTGCLVRNNNTKGWNRAWGGGGNKLGLCRNAVIEKSQFIDNRGTGIWFDIGNEDCVVRNCLISGNEGAGIFYEISYGLHAHDNVVIGNGWGDAYGDWGANGAIALSSSPNCLIERNLMVANKEGFQFREQYRTTPRIGRDPKAEEPVWNHDSVIRNNIIAYNGVVQTAGWFAQKDERHWPRSMQQAAPAPNDGSLHDNAKAYTARDDRAQPTGLSLEDLHITMTNNLYAAAPGQRLFQWGPAFGGDWRHKDYDSLDGVRRDLSLETGSVVADLVFVGGCMDLDFRLPLSSLAFTRECYPRGAVPGVNLSGGGRE